MATESNSSSQHLVGGESDTASLSIFLCASQLVDNTLLVRVTSSSETVFDYHIATYNKANTQRCLDRSSDTSRLDGSY